MHTRLYGQHKIIPLCKVHTKGNIAVRGFLRKKIQGGGGGGGGQTNVSRNRGGGEEGA